MEGYTTPQNSFPATIWWVFHQTDLVQFECLIKQLACTVQNPDKTHIKKQNSEQSKLPFERNPNKINQIQVKRSN